MPRPGDFPPTVLLVETSTSDKSSLEIVFNAEDAEGFDHVQKYAAVPMPDSKALEVPAGAVEAFMRRRIAETFGDQYISLHGWPKFLRDRPADAARYRELAESDVRAALSAIREHDRLQRVQGKIEDRKAIRAAVLEEVREALEAEADRMRDRASRLYGDHNDFSAGAAQGQANALRVGARFVAALSQPSSDNQGEGR
jgi:hypothetical protein